MDLEALARKCSLFFSSTGLKQMMGELFGNKLDAWREAQRGGKSLIDVVASFEDEEHDKDDEWSSEPAARQSRPRWLRPLAGALGLLALVGIAGAVALRSRHR